MSSRSEAPSENVVDEARQLFRSHFGRDPDYLVLAPGRVNLIGEHVDYNDGLVLPMAIERHLVFAASPNDEESFNAVTPIADEPLRFSTSRRVERGEPSWSNYVRGVVALFQEKGIAVPGIDLAIASNLPLGGGLSSSAALEVGLATLLEVLTETYLPGTEKAKLCQRAEHEYTGVPCGIMDQFAVTFGRRDHLLLLDCESETYTYVPFAHPDIAVLIINSKVKHALSDGEYARRRSDCQEACELLGVSSLRHIPFSDLQSTLGRLSDEKLRRRVRHVVTEIERTRVFAKAIAQNEFTEAGKAMFASHVSLRNDYEVSCRELDLLVELATEHVGKGIYGSRMTGGGFGGCTVSLVEASRAAELAETICERYATLTGIEPESFITRAADGARPLDHPSLTNDPTD